MCGAIKAFSHIKSVAPKQHFSRKMQDTSNTLSTFSTLSLISSSAPGAATCTGDYYTEVAAHAPEARLEGESLDFRRKARVSRRAGVIDGRVLSLTLKRLRRLLTIRFGRKMTSAAFIFSLISNNSIILLQYPCECCPFIKTFSYICDVNRLLPSDITYCESVFSQVLYRKCGSFHNSWTIRNNTHFRIDTCGRYAFCVPVPHIYPSVGYCVVYCY